MSTLEVNGFAKFDSSGIALGTSPYEINVNTARVVNLTVTNASITPPTVDNTGTVLAVVSGGGIRTRNDIVNTTSAQTITGKTMDYNDNTFLNFPSATVTPTNVVTLTNKTLPSFRTGLIQNILNNGTILYGTGAGTGPTTVSLFAGSVSGIVTFQTGTTPAAGGDIFRITLPFDTITGDYSVVFSPENNASAILLTQPYATPVSSTVFRLVSTTALASNTVYSWTYHIISYN